MADELDKCNYLHVKVKTCYLAPYVSLKVLDIDLYIHSEGFSSAQACVVGIVLYSRQHEKYWIFLVPLSLSNQFSIVTAVCHESIVWRHTPRWIDLWASASQFSSSCQGEWNRNHSQWWKLAFLYLTQYLPKVIFTLQGPSRSYEGRLHNTRQETPYKL